MKNDHFRDCHRSASALWSSRLHRDRAIGLTSPYGAENTAAAPASAHTVRWASDLHQLIAAARLPLPETNARVEGSERDFVWRTKRLVVEVDGFHFHSGRARFESDRRRDAELVAAGFRVLRVTWRQMEQEPMAVIASIAQALAR